LETEDLAGAPETFAAVVSSAGAVVVVEAPVLPCLFFLVVLARALVPVAAGVVLLVPVAEGFVAGELFPAAVLVADVVEAGVFAVLVVPALVEVELFFFLWRDDL
jgi:hypothetical protein